ncbi:hypothetical protein [Aestuariivirga litoralis]|uniref:hypothetical protein n=1 Tax=Aestuariivirga litoralis TaxID=2650924 RepID=UPI0018C61C14|nr:hypothetical protein [Aestuariivirga litoralis]MBG1231698.1 hypothetical protein [Aestuariivirga litoralis]
MKWFKILLAMAALVICGAASAENLKLSGKQRWLAIASSQDKDVAIGIARVQAGQKGVRVVSSNSGYYGVISGPYNVNSISNLKKNDPDQVFTSLPSDALLSQGANYIETVWQRPADGKVEFKPYTLKKPLALSSDTVKARVYVSKDSKDSAHTVIEGHDAEGDFRVDIGKDASDDASLGPDEFDNPDFFTAALVDNLAGPEGQVVIVKNFTGGAHCCTLTYFATRIDQDKNWSLVSADGQDGEGFSYEDVNNDDSLEVIGVDNAFLYAFDCYACSYAPVKIYEVYDGALKDLSGDADMRPRLVQDLAAMEFQAKLNADLWKGNGFLAAWVAAKIRLGQGDEAWGKFLKNYDTESTFGPQTCTTGARVEDCPEDKLQAIPIPKALAQFLKDNGYEPLPKAAEAELQ